MYTHTTGDEGVTGLMYTQTTGDEGVTGLMYTQTTCDVGVTGLMWWVIETVNKKQIMSLTTDVKEQSAKGTTHQSVMALIYPSDTLPYSDTHPK